MNFNRIKITRSFAAHVIHKAEKSKVKKNIKATYDNMKSTEILKQILTY